jgi:MFS family permease
MSKFRFNVASWAPEPYPKRPRRYGPIFRSLILTRHNVGMNTSTVPTWASETSKSHKRGKMVMIEGAMITGGICLSYWVDFGFSFLEPSTVSWRFPIAFQIFFALILLAFILELPESPRVSRIFRYHGTLNRL